MHRCLMTQICLFSKQILVEAFWRRGDVTCKTCLRKSWLTLKWTHFLYSSGGLLSVCYIELRVTSWNVLSKGIKKTMLLIPKHLKVKYLTIALLLCYNSSKHGVLSIKQWARKMDCAYNYISFSNKLVHLLYLMYFMRAIPHVHFYDLWARLEE